jgi:hypothetical protein
MNKEEANRLIKIVSKLIEGTEDIYPKTFENLYQDDPKIKDKIFDNIENLISENLTFRLKPDDVKFYKKLKINSNSQMKLEIKETVLNAYKQIIAIENQKDKC